MFHALCYYNIHLLLYEIAQMSIIHVKESHIDLAHASLFDEVYNRKH